VSKDTVKELGSAKDLVADELLRTLVSQMFENDNDTSFLNATLESSDGSKSELEFMIRIVSINGIKTRAEEEESK
jgi:hypothetical protein